MIVIDIDISLLKEKLHAAEQEFSPDAFLKGLGEEQMQWIASNFATRGGKVGGWKELSPNTVAGRRLGSSAPLQDSGRLRQSFGYEVVGNELKTGTGVRVGTNVRYASSHEQGVPASKINPIVPKHLRKEVRVIRGRPRVVTLGALSFMTAHGRMFRMSVHNHPGIPRRRMLPDKPEVVLMANALIYARVTRINAMRRYG